MKSLKIALLLFFTTLIFLNITAQQNDEFPKLTKLYNEQKYEACLMKSEKLTYNDKTKREPLPYLFLSKSYYQLSLSDDPDIQEYYPKALRNAVKYAVKFKQKDKRGVYFPKNTDYIDQLTKTFLEKTQELYDNGKYSKVSSNYKLLLKLINDANVKFAKGVCDALNNNFNEAETNISEAVTNIGKKENTNPVTNYLFNTYIVDYSDYLFRNEQVDSAFSTINFGLKQKPGNEAFKYQKEKLENLFESMKKDDGKKE